MAMNRSLFSRFGTGLTVIFFTACASTKVVEEPQEIVLDKPLATHADEPIDVALDWVLIRNGPGSWVTNADWDEYLVTITNRTGIPIWIVEIAITDSLGARVETIADRKLLVEGTKHTAKRYQDHDIEVHAGVTGRGLANAAIAAGVVSYTATAYTVAATSAGYGGAASAAGLAGVAVGALVLVPVLAGSSMVKSSHEREVQDEITTRATRIPLQLQAGESQRLDVFFPLAPSPSNMEFTVRREGRNEVVVMDTREVLSGLHLELSEQ